MGSGEEEMEKTDDKPKNADKKEIRRRKKHLYSAIRKQMEFYFGDANLAKDRFLSKCIAENEDGYIPLNVFLSFNKLRAMTTDIKMLKKSMKHSTLLKLSEDGNSVRRTTEVVIRPDVDDCTVYVERFPPDIDHDWLRQTFTPFGDITYISLPRFQNKSLKGFAFIEFEKPESAQKAHRYYYSLCHPNSIIPDEISNSGRGNRDKKAQSDLRAKSKTVEGEVNKLKRKLSENESENQAKDENSCDEKQKKQSKINDKSTDDKNIEVEAQSVESHNEETKKASTISKKKKSRKKKKKLMPIKEMPCIFPLRVMLKNDWKIAKKQYLSIQKANMAKIKVSLLTFTPELKANSEKMTKEVSEEHVPKESKKKAYEFVPGAIVSFDIPKNCQDPNTYKNLKSNAGVKYVDVDESNSKVFIRCDNSSSAQDLVKTIDEDAAVLTGNSEKDYWTKLWQDHEMRHEKKTKVKKRGVEKVKARVERAIQLRNKHIHFDE